MASQIEFKNCPNSLNLLHISYHIILKKNKYNICFVWVSQPVSLTSADHPTRISMISYPFVKVKYTYFCGEIDYFVNSFVNHNES